MSNPIGLIAGEGVFPLLVADGARAAGRRIVCAALAGCASPELEGKCDVYRSVGIARLGAWVRHLKKHDVREAIMVGRVVKTKMYSRLGILQYIPDLRTARLLITELRRDKRPAAMLNAIANELAREGITLINSTTYTPGLLADEGVMTRTQPTEAQWQDIRHGWPLCKQISALDIGQSIAVLHKDVLAVEALEGTNAMIDRAGQLCKRPGWTLVKVANSQADMRMDVPTIGLTTIEKLIAAKAGCIVLEVGKTVLLDRQKVLALADDHGISIVGQR